MTLKQLELPLNLPSIDMEQKIIDKRKANARTLIQLGALIHKSGLTDILGITLGSDLKKNPKLEEPSSFLLNELISMKERISPQTSSLKEIIL